MAASSPVGRMKELLEKTKNYDADERFMAMHDLVEQLKAMTHPLDAALQVPVRDTILRLLNDGSSDVATVSVNLSQLVTRLNAAEVAYITDRLGSLISSPEASLSSSSSSYGDDDSQRSMSLDIVSDSLQTIISSSSPENGKSLAPKLLANLLTALSTISARDLDRTMSCLSGDHMVMSRSGWLPIAVIHRAFAAAKAAGAAQPVLEVSTFNDTTYAMEWKRVQETQCFPAKDHRFFRMQNEGMDVLATEDHRMLIGRLGEVRVDGKVRNRLVPGSFTTPTVDKLTALAFFRTPGSTVTGFSSHRSHMVVRCGDNQQPGYKFVIAGMEEVCEGWWERRLPSGEKDQQRSFLRFVGFWLGDGHLDVQGGQVVLSQRKLAGVAWLIDLLDEVFPRWWYRKVSARDAMGITFNFHIRCPPLYEWLRVMAVGPPGYVATDRTSIRSYPHFPYVEALAALEAESRYRPRPGPGRWTEAEMLAAMVEGPVRRPCCFCERSDGERLSCSGTHCHPVTSITRAHPRCVVVEDATPAARVRLEAVRAFKQPWFCPHPDCQADKAQWVLAHPAEASLAAPRASAKKGAAPSPSRAKKPQTRRGSAAPIRTPRRVSASDSDSDGDGDEEAAAGVSDEEEAEAGDADEVMPTRGPTRSGRESKAPKRYAEESFPRSSSEADLKEPPAPVAQRRRSSSSSKRRRSPSASAVVCGVCDLGESDGNPMKLCTGCTRAHVHESCALDAAPKVGWLCDPCKASLDDAFFDGGELEALALGAADGEERKEEPAHAAAEPPLPQAAISLAPEAAAPEAVSDADDKAAALSIEGKSLYAAGEFARAVGRFAQAIALCPTSAVCFANRAAAYSKLGEYAMAMRDCRRAIALDPLYGKAYFRMGRVLADVGKYSDAIRVFEAALPLFGDDIDMRRMVEGDLNAARGAAAEEARQVTVVLPDGSRVVMTDYDVQPMDEDEERREQKEAPAFDWDALEAELPAEDAKALARLKRAKAAHAAGTGVYHYRVSPAVIIGWNGGLWCIINGNWFYLKRWLGPPGRVAATFANLSQRQAVALLEGFNRADGYWEDIDVTADGKGKGSWRCTSSSMPLIHHLQLIGQLAGARVDLSRHSEQGKENTAGPGGRIIPTTVDHWVLSLNFNKIAHAEHVHLSMLAKPVDVTDNTDNARGYYEYEEDGLVYDLTMQDNSNFLTQRLSLKRISTTDEDGVTNLDVRAHPVYVGNCLTLLKAVIERYGADIAEQQKAISDCLLRLLSHPQDAVKKRASVTLGPLVYVVDDALFLSLMSTLITGMDATNSSPEIFIQSVSAISKAAGVRVGGYLDQIIPRLSRFLTMTREEEAGEEPSESRIELLETSLQAIEAVILRCPTKVTPYVQQLVNLGVVWSTYDPLYTYEDDDDLSDDGMTDSAARQPKGKAQPQRSSTEAMDEDDGEGWNDAAQSNGAGDDDWGDAADDGAGAGADNGPAAATWGAEDEDSGGISAGSNDTSWKVRRAAVGVLSAFIKARSDLLKSYYTLLIEHLIRRMKERDSAVKEELLLACRDLLRESVVSDRSASPPTSNAALPSPFPAAASDELPGSFLQPLFIRTRSTYAVLDSKTPQLITSVERQFTGADIRTQQAIFAVLTELFQVRHGQLALFLPRIIPHCTAAMKATGKQASVNADALLFVRLVLESHTHTEVQPYLADLTDATIKSIRSGLPKNLSAALAVLTAVATHLPFAQPPALVAQLSKDVFRVVFAQLEQSDVPLDVKLSSISTMAVLLSNVGAQLKADAPRVWPVFAERMSNESTCQPILRAVSKIASSGLVDSSAMVGHTEEMVSFIRKSSHHLRHNTVKALECLLTQHPQAFHPQQVALIIGQIAPYIDDGDLQLTHLVLELLSTILRTSASTPSAPAVLSAVSADITDSAMTLALSPLLQGQSLTSLILFFQQLVRAKRATPANLSAASSAAVAYPALLSSLLSRVTRSISPPAFSTLGRVVATITEEASAEERQATIRQMLEEVQNDSKKDHNFALTTLALLFLGEIGRRSDLSYVDGLEAVLLQSFNSGSESVRRAAAFALGNVALGHMAKFLPRLLHLISAEKRFTYLLLSALKEIIAFYSTSKPQLTAFAPFLDAVSPVLFAHTDSSDESTRAMVSECLGRLVVVAPSALLPRLEQLTRSPSPHVRAVCITALRFSFTPLMDQALLRQSLAQFLSLLNDEDLEVKRQAVLSLNALFRSHVELLDAGLLSSAILPALFAQTKPIPALIREIDYGAFKSIVDDGKPLRKAAFQALATLLDTAPHRLDLHRLILAVQQGLTDQDDIQLSSYATYTQMAHQCPQVVLESLDQLPKLMMAPIKQHLAAAKSTKEPESALECLRAVVRCMLVFNAMEGVELCTVYTHFFKQVCATPLLVQIIKEIKEGQQKS